MSQPSPQIRLTKQQQGLLRMDIAEVNHPDDAAIIAELRAGVVLTVTPQVIESLKEFADRDAYPSEQRAYRKLLSTALLALNEPTPS